MPWIFKPERWKEQPSSPVLLDYSHPLVSGGYLVCAVLPWMETPEGWTQGGSSTLGLGQSVGGICWEGGTNKYLSMGYTKPSQFASVQVIWHPPASASANKGIFSLASTATTTNPWVLLSTDASGNPRWYTSADYMAAYSNYNSGAGKTAILQLSYDGTNWNSYTSGRYVSLRAGFGVLSASYIFIGSGYNGQADGQIDQILVWNELCVTQDQFMELAISPYSLWMRDPELVYFIPAAAGGISVPVAYHQRQTQGIAS